MTDQRRLLVQSRGLSASYSQLRRNGVQNSNVSRLSIRNQGATPDIVVTPPQMYTVPTVHEPFFDEFTVQEFRTARFPSDRRQQSFQSLLFRGETSDLEGEINTPSSAQLPLEWSSLWLTRGEEDSGHLESAASETIRRSSAAQESDNAVSSRVRELDNFVFSDTHELQNAVPSGVPEMENFVFPSAQEQLNVRSTDVQEFENVVSPSANRLDNAVSGIIQEFGNAVFHGAYRLDNAVSSGVHENENVVLSGVQEQDNSASAVLEELENVVSSGLVTKRPRTHHLDDEEDEARKQERKVQKRKESNRVSAQRCREKRKLSQQQMEDEMEKLWNENSQLRDHLHALQGENVALERRISELEALGQSMLSTLDRQSTDPTIGSTPEFNYHLQRRYL